MPADKPRPPAPPPGLDNTTAAGPPPGTVPQTFSLAAQAARASDPNRIGAQPPLPLVPGYRLGPVLGGGGMGVVYRARDLALDRDVAVKLLRDEFPTDSAVARRFLDEARITAQLQHPAVP